MSNTTTNQYPDMVVKDNGKKVSILCKDLHEIPSNLYQKFGNSIEELNLSFNQITKITNLEKLTNLKKLILDNNNIVNPGENFPVLPNLEVLWINKNVIADLEPLLEKLEKCPKMKYLSLLKNPCCPNELLGNSQEEYVRYRLYILFRLPNLKFLDALEVCKTERLDANKRGRFFKVKKIKPTINIKSNESIKKIEGGIPEGFEQKRKLHSYFGYSRQVYTGKHSEGNRFIKNKNL